MSILEGLPQTSMTGALHLLNAAEVCRLGYWDGSRPSVLPMNFVYLDNSIFLHTGPNRGKLKAVKRFPMVCIQIDDIRGMVAGNNPCGISYSFISLLIHGNASVETAPEMKQKVLSGFAEKYSGEPFAFTDAQLDSVAVLKITPASADVKIKHMDKPA